MPLKRAVNGINTEDVKRKRAEKSTETPEQHEMHLTDCEINSQELPKQHAILQ